MPKGKGKGEKKIGLLFAILIGFAVVSFWRGVWGLMDEFLFPNNYTLSLVISVALGLAILIYTKYARKELI
jgi:Fuseless